ncbi:guided entry of tail-anchored proteins factor 1 isoform X2 [Rhodnius prolixus]|uniref:Guided entry of tail-anchored proteins factor 1 n=1 Tax=Rhodnius prolixus TaxID=13249 RepID=A0A4P6D797_RHOPR
MYYLIVFSIILSFLNAFLPFIARSVARAVRRYKPNSALQNEIEKIKRSMCEISVKDEFAKYTKLQRILNKKREELKAEVLVFKKYQLKIKLGIQYVTQAILTLVCLILFWMQRSTPVVILNENWLYPFGSILSWPTHIPGALSFPLWFLVSNTVAKIATLPFAKLLN